MKPLDKNYQTQLDAIALEIQNSEVLQSYLDEESEELFKQLQEKYEPLIHGVYHEVAVNNPLQIISLEKAILRDDFEGLFIPRILGYTVLRGEINSNIKYVRQQDHLREIIEFMVASPNFEYIRRRCGQTLQIGFSLSSDIYITNLCEGIENKKIVQFLQAQKLDRLRDTTERKNSYNKYRNQFKNEIYFTADFPTNLNELKLYFNSLKEFLHIRVAKRLNIESLNDSLMSFIRTKEFQKEPEYIVILGYAINFMQFSAKDDAEVSGIFNDLRKSTPDFCKQYFNFVRESLYSDVNLDSVADASLLSKIDQTIKDDITLYYKLVNVIHTKGYIHEDTMDAVKSFYGYHAGLSSVNECVRRVIYNYFEKLLLNLEPADYATFFDLSKVYQTYFDIFSNEHFTQDVKHLSMSYTDKLLKVFTDKRGKDYQEIKRFVSSSFVDFGFLKEKEVVEIFKTRRKVS